MKKFWIAILGILCLGMCGCSNNGDITSNDIVDESSEYDNLDREDNYEEKDIQISDDVTIDETHEDDSSDISLSNEEIQSKVIEFEQWLINNAYANDVWYIEDVFAEEGDDIDMWMWSVSDSTEKGVIDSYLEYFWSVGVARTCGYSSDGEGNQIPNSVEVSYTVTEEKFNIITGVTEVVERDVIVSISIQEGYDFYDMVMYN